MELKRKIYIEQWKKGEKSGGMGIRAKGVSRFVRQYLLDKFEAKCSQCGWKEMNSTTRSVPVEIDHIDGNSENNKEDNLRLLCPNCHSLTASYKNLNKGKGRKWRMEKYIKNDIV